MRFFMVCAVLVVAAVLVFIRINHFKDMPPIAVERERLVVDPRLIARIAPNQTLVVSSKVFDVQTLNGRELLTYSGKRQRLFTLNFCERSKRIPGREWELYPIYLGISLDELKSNLPNADYRGIDSNFIDGNTDYPAVKITAVSVGRYDVKPLDEASNYYTDIGGNSFEMLGIVVAKNSTSLLHFEQIKLPACELGGLRIQSYRLDENSVQKHFVLLAADDVIEGEMGVGEFRHEAYNQAIDSVQALANAAIDCGFAWDNGFWHLANAYAYQNVEQLPEMLTRTLRSTKQCRGVLKALYATPSGHVLQQRIAQINTARAPLVAVKVQQKEPAQRVQVFTASNQLPLALVSKKLQGQREQLLYLKADQPAGGWLQSTQPLLIDITTSATTELMLVADSFEVITGQLVEQRNLCIPRVCEQQAQQLTLSPNANGRVQLTLNPVVQKPYLLQEVVDDFNAPSPPQNPSIQKSTAEAVALYTAQDRHGHELGAYDLPSLVGDWPGAPIPLTSTKPLRVTVSIDLQRQIQTILDEFLQSLPPDANRLASFSVADDTGAILASAQNPHPVVGDNLHKLAFEAQTNPANSPLFLQAAYQSGAARNVSGSVFKLVSALYFADHFPEAVTKKSLEEWGQDPEAKELGFSPSAKCYPAFNNQCAAGAIHIFETKGVALTMAERSAHYADQVYGIQNSIRDSNNGFYAHLAERSHDVGNYYATKSLDDIEDAASGIRTLAHHLGFEQPLPIFPITASPSMLVDVTNKAKLLRLAVGEQNSVTAAQILQLALDIATEQHTPLHFTEAAAPTRLPISAHAFATVKDGMQQAAASYKAFAPLLAPLAEQGVTIFAKTGTGSYQVGEANKHNTYTAGFIAKENHKVAFTCRVSDVELIAGETCGHLTSKIIPLLLAYL